MKSKKRSRIISNILMIILSIITLIPIYFLLNNAFKKKQYIYKQPMILTPESFTFDNIIKAFSLMKFPRTSLNSLMILVISCGGLILFGSMVAFVIAINKRGWTRWLYTAAIILLTVPVSCAQIPLARELSDMGLINTWLGTSLVYIAFGLPFTIFIFSGYSNSIPVEIWEAAKIDGCNLVQLYVSIYMPLVKMTTATIIIMRGSYIWNDILVPMITVSKSAFQTLPQKLCSFAGANLSRWELMFAATLIVSLPSLIIYILLQKAFVGALTAGSVKG